MSQFRSYVVAEFKLKDIPSLPMIHRTKPGFADHDINWEYFEVVEYSALEAAQKEIAELKKENEEIKIKMSGVAGATVGSISKEYISKIEQLTAALKVAEDALRLIASPDENEPNWFHLTSRKALSEIEKIKKGLG